MRTAAAYISKLKAQALGRTFKVQDTNHRALTSTLYRGAAGCAPVDYAQLDYKEICSCKYIGPARRPGAPLPPEPVVLDCGSPSTESILVVECGGPANTDTFTYDAGIP